jgi:diadenosine tetraphosphate (Ap4A) HIT family hydrolase
MSSRPQVKKVKNRDRPVSSDLDQLDQLDHQHRCVFCRRNTLANILHESEHFLLLADHAPVVGGHLLILPRAHLACYGAVPAQLDAEFLDLKSQVINFCRAIYRAPVFFEHGVYRQTVAHAHLHAIPIGSFPEAIVAISNESGRPVTSQEDIRSWYETEGHYFYLERLAGDGRLANATIFPPRGDLYYRVLTVLREQTGGPGGWQLQPVRRLTGGTKIHALVNAWQQQHAG